ncbi:AmmeMemoRadiSam system protein B [Fimbriiglobus ruber]|uniref:AmmeMemoRadiSam system protein B n=1 Tax=Fimbriiglobus ruber TaxID=1908690 RepID=UPI00137A75C3|nr:AmmeMemoRadiSam system protein B [Fimbriiglobus ruber]
MAPSPIITPDFRPRLRPRLAAARSPDPAALVLYDPNRLSPSVVTFPQHQLTWAERFTGASTLYEIQAALGLSSSTELISFVTTLDDALLLDSPAFRSYLNGPVRRPACIGCYPEEPAAIREMMRGLFTAPGGPGLPRDPAAVPPAPGKLRAALVPHMDYARGGVTYGWGFQELIEQTDASLFVIVATSHYSPKRFTLTRMNFATPLGTVETDQAYIDRLVAAYGTGLFDDPVAHLPEHSIELEVVLLQYLLENRRPFRIVPLLVGSFHDCVDRGTSPEAAADIARMVAALQAAEAGAGESVCYLISGDLAHIGPKFRDPNPVDGPQLTASRNGDETLLKHLTAADPQGYFAAIAAEGDARRICGLPPTWLTLQALRPRAGRVLHYNQYVHPAGHESVSYAAAAFYE